MGYGKSLGQGLVLQPKFVPWLGVTSKVCGVIKGRGKSFWPGLGSQKATRFQDQCQRNDKSSILLVERVLSLLSQ